MTMGDSAQVGALSSVDAENGAADAGDTSYKATSTAAKNPGGNGAAMSMTAIGGITSAIGQYYSGQANKAIAGANAQIAGIQAQEAERTGVFASNRAVIRGHQIEEQQRASQAASGVVVGAGTAGSALESTEAASHMDALMIQRNAAREALGYQLKATNDTMHGRLAESSADMGAISTLLNTGAQEWLETDPNYTGLRGSGVRFSGGP